MRTSRHSRVRARVWASAALVVIGLPVVGATRALAAGTVTDSRIQGVNRFATAAQIAATTFSSANSAVLANGLTTADALSAGYLAGYLKAPVLLTITATTPPETLSALSHLGVKNVYVLGGPLAVSDAQYQALSQTASTNPAGGDLVLTRVAGSDRFQTSNAVDTIPPASNVGTVAGVPTALVANGDNFPDALAGGALADGAALPMVLTDPAQLSPPAAATLASLAIKQVEILGGSAAVSQAVQDQISSMGITVQRIAGINRYQTALDIAAFAGSQVGFTPSRDCDLAGCSFASLLVARGDDGGGGVDALALAPLAAQDTSPILLAATPDDPSGPTAGEVALSASSGTLSTFALVGGTTALTPAVQSFLETAAGIGAHPAFTAAPTTVAPGATIVLGDGGTPCPAIPAGSAAYNGAYLLPATAGAAPGQVFFGAAPVGGGHWSDTIAVGATTPAGSYTLQAVCAASFAGDPTHYSYVEYAPITISVS
ncbi:MAG TPA: cell wall-binding repeat-containing protein [Acidimicrobiales bacterium]